MTTLGEIIEQEYIPFHNYGEAIDWIVGRTAFGIKPGLERMELLMERLGNPERRLKFIHVAGTNGKGSTCAFLTEVLLQNGYDVGTFTSPYIEKYTSRIQYNRNHIEEDDLVRICNELKPIVDEIGETDFGAPTMFEISTALAIVYFARVAYPDYVVWETGLGGRLDSTNIVNPVVSIITNIGHDHMEVLGDSLVKVAGEKAGIIKAGVPVIIAIEQSECIEVIETRCKQLKSTLYRMGDQFEWQSVASQLNHQSFDFMGPFRQIAGLEITMNGSYQVKNASVAVMTLEILRQYYALIVEDDALRAGLKATHWPGRLEMISQHPPILLDGAHNPEGAETLAVALKEIYRYKKRRLLLGMMATKNHSGYLRHILPMIDTIVVTEPDFRNKMDAAKLGDLVRNLVDEMDFKVEVIVQADWKLAFSELLSHTEPGDLAVVTGTLYLISDVRTWILYQSDSEKGW